MSLKRSKNGSSRFASTAESWLGWSAAKVNMNRRFVFHISGGYFTGSISSYATYASTRLSQIAGLAAAGSPLAGQQMQMQSFLAPAGSAGHRQDRFHAAKSRPSRSNWRPIVSSARSATTALRRGRCLRMKEGVPVTVNVVNNTDVPETVHFHGLLIPSDVDGSEEEGTPVVPPHGSRSYRFTPTPAGTRWYHTHTMSMDDLHRGSYTGMFGFLIIEGANNPGNFDQEHYLALRDWEPYFTNQLMDNDDLDPALAQPKSPRCSIRGPPGWRSRPTFSPSTTKRSARESRSA